MTVETAVARSGPYAGAGTTGPFPVVFRFLDNSHLSVVQTSAAGVETVLVLGVDFTATGAGADSGTVSTIVAVPAGETLLVLRNVPLTQLTDYVQSDAFPAQSHEDALDKLTMIEQQHDAAIARTLRVPEAVAAFPNLPPIADRAGRVLGFDASGNPIGILPSAGDATALALDLMSTSSALKGAGQVGFLSSLLYGTGTVGKFIVDLIASFAASTGSSLVGFIQTGVGSILRTVQDRLRDGPPIVTDFGAVMNSSGASVRTANSVALLATIALGRTADIPAGTLWVDSTALAGFWHIKGAGSASTFIRGDGNLFALTAPDNGEMRLFEHLTILNDTTRGKLFTNVGTTNRIEFDHVNFAKAAYHTYSSGGDAVNWSFNECRFSDASVESRHFEGLWAMSDRNPYTWFCKIGLRCTNGNVRSSNTFGGVYEQNDDSGIVLEANNVSGEIDGFNLFGTHFEVNGKVTNAADIAISTGASTRVRNVTALGVVFDTPTVAQTVRVSVVNGGGGNIDCVNLENFTLIGAVALCTNTGMVKARNAYFQALAMPASVIVPVQVAQGFSGNFLGSVLAVGVNNGSSGVQCSVIPPANARTVDIYVDGNSYNGAPNTHIGTLYARYTAVNGNVRAITDVNHTSGSNQGWIASWTGSAIQVANKAAMTNNQSGDTRCVFWS